MVTELTYPGVVPMNNGRGGLLRMHWTKRRKLQDSYTWLTRSLTANRHEGPVRMELIRYSSSHTVADFGNLVSSDKLILDAIVNAGVLPDDNQTVIPQRDYKQIKCKPSEQRTVIRITDIDNE
jgi:Holliday junction resolvase RusA-like endonuclease